MKCLSFLTAYRLFLITDLTQSKTTWEGNPNEELFSSDWLVSMSVEDHVG